MYKDIPIAAIPPWEMCPRCQCYLIDLYNLKHDELCDYFYFRNVEASKLGYSSVTKVHDSYYLKTIFEIHNVPYRAFHVNGIAGHYWDIFVPVEIAGLIDLYHTKEGYAGMSLEEYITTIVLPEAI